MADQIKNFDTAFCGNLPLHLTNLIQNYGALIVVDKLNYEIIQVSENLVDIVGIAAPAALSTPLSELFPQNEYQHFLSAINSGKNRIPVTLKLDHDQLQLLALVHVKQHYIIIELEHRDTNEQDSGFLQIYQKLRFIISDIEETNSIDLLCQVVLRELYHLSQFDRIMIYQFDEEWHGKVLAEIKSDHIQDSYLGLKFPASDIPAPARELYKKNPYRLIPDRNYKPVRLSPVLNPLTGGFTDLSDCNLRSVATVHIEYLGNMDVTASMSTRIMVDNKLWGLVSCHHSSPKYLDFEMSAVFELISTIFSSKLASLKSNADFKANSALQQMNHQLLQQVKERGIEEGLLNFDLNLMDMFESNGVALSINGKLIMQGSTPDSNQVKDLMLWLQNTQANKIFHANNLPMQYDSAIPYSGSASGLIAVPLQAEGDFLLLFRPEVTQTESWGGNPNTALQFEDDGKSYHPRNSFRLWQNLVRHRSNPWKESQVAAALQLQNSLLEYIYKSA